MAIGIIILFSTLVLRQLSLKHSHPIRLIAVTLVLGLIASVRLVFYVGPLFGVVYFITLLGGILVVFAFSVALVSYSHNLKRRFDKADRGFGKNLGLKGRGLLLIFLIVALKFYKVLALS